MAPNRSLIYPYTFNNRYIAMFSDNAVDTYLNDTERRLRDGFALVDDEDEVITENPDTWCWIDTREPVLDIDHLPIHWVFEVPA